MSQDTGTEQSCSGSRLPAAGSADTQVGGWWTCTCFLKSGHLQTATVSGKANLSLSPAGVSPGHSGPLLWTCQSCCSAVSGHWPPGRDQGWWQNPAYLCHPLPARATEWLGWSPAGSLSPSASVPGPPKYPPFSQGCWLPVVCTALPSSRQFPWGMGSREGSPGVSARSPFHVVGGSCQDTGFSCR